MNTARRSSCLASRSPRRRSAAALIVSPRRRSAAALIVSPRRRSAAALIIALGALLGLLGCAKGGTSIDEDLTAAAGGPLGEEEDLCGNGKIDEDADEECDGAKLGRASCISLGFSAGGMLTCDPENCIYDTTMCKLPPTQSNNGGGGG